MTKLFISYRSLDSAKVDALVSRLRSIKEVGNTTQYTVWQDKTGILDGQDWWESIVDAIIDSDVFVYMVSRESVQNVNCRAELSYARKRNRPVIAVVLEGEFFHNSITGKNDIDYWSDIPNELNDLRSQFLFYEGANFLPRLQAAIDQFQREPQRWRDIPADRPRDPRDASDETNNTIALYDEACDYAGRLELNTAERLFQKLVNMNDPDFGDEAHQWIVLLRDYQKLIAFDARDSTRHRVRPAWDQYFQQFPKPFIPLFDPKDFKTRFDNVSAPPAPPSPTRSKIPNILPPPFEWIDIPEGKVTLIEDDDDQSYFGKKGASKVFEVPTFTIAKYPVTNAQFRKFIEAGGYSQKKWWTEAGWQQKEKESWEQPRYWQQNQWNGAQQPVVGISWYEAIAFCQWLSEIGGESILLPTEQQWQRAAQGDDGRVYPWGNDWYCERCNNSVKPCDSNSTTPVTHYAGKGDSPFGVVDMAGNVWEWCLTQYITGENHLDGTDVRVLRGGSWDGLNTSLFRCDDRLRGNPNFWHSFRGFRVSRS